MFAVHTIWILLCMCLTVCALTTSSHSYVNVSILGVHLGSHSPLKDMTHAVHKETINVESLVKMAEGLLKPNK